MINMTYHSYFYVSDIFFSNNFIRLLFSKTLSEYVSKQIYQNNFQKIYIRIFLVLMFQTHVSPAAAFENPRWELWKIPCFRNFCENVLAVMFCIYMFNSETWPFFSEWVVKLCKYRRDQTVRTTRHLLMLPTTFVSTIDCFRF